MDEKVLKGLRERRKTALDAADAIVSLAETEERGLTPDEDKNVAEYLAEAERVKGEIESADRARNARQALDEAKRYAPPEMMRAATSPEPAAKTEDVLPSIKVFESEHRAYQRGDALGAIVAARMRFGPWAHQQAINWARSTYGESSPQCRALQQSNFTSGGAFIPENFVGGEFIELLRAQAKVRGAGARSITLTNGSATIPKITGGATGAWIGSEGDNVAPSEPTSGQVILAEKKYMVLVPISNDLRRNSSLETERVVRDDMVRVAANDEDVAFLRGTGATGQPKGIYNWIPAAGKANSAGTTLANVRTDIRTAKNRLNNNNVPSSRRAWFIHSRAAEYLGWDLVDGNGNFAFPQMQQENGASLGGGLVHRNNNISVSLGGGTDTEVYYVEMSECFIGDNMAMEIEIIENAVYDVSGTLRSGVSRDESVIRMIRKTDFAMRHTESAFVLEAVAWGA